MDTSFMPPRIFDQLDVPHEVIEVGRPLHEIQAELARESEQDRARRALDLAAEEDLAAMGLLGKRSRVTHRWLLKVPEGSAEAVEDWSGGTRLGDALRAFNDEWGVRGMARGADVAILSDGWDRGDPEVMDEPHASKERRCL